ncbi:hypothetical protein [Edaphovirga cremea]|uniref:hypothetical protein n=1 Tax=Edaphovirga cremea TaxID=2267246 RepID=UPI000DEFC721|nr:hypothetical protein [Edaphovirga cremea]
MDARSIVVSNGFSYKELLKFKNDYLKFKKELKRAGEEEGRGMSFIESIIFVSKDSVKSILTLFIMSLFYILATIVFDFKQTLFAVPFLAFFVIAEIYKNAKSENHSILTEIKLIKLGLRIKINQLS